MNEKHRTLQAPLATVHAHYNSTATDTFKVAGAMITELDDGVGRVAAALRDAGVLEKAILAFCSDNGGALDHAANFPLRGGKHTMVRAAKLEPS